LHVSLAVHVRVDSVLPEQVRSVVPLQFGTFEAFQCPVVSHCLSVPCEHEYGVCAEQSSHSRFVASQSVQVWAVGVVTAPPGQVLNVVPLHADDAATQRPFASHERSVVPLQEYSPARHWSHSPRSSSQWLALAHSVWLSHSPSGLQTRSWAPLHE
jgi:hypothetical protein